MTLPYFRGCWTDEDGEAHFYSHGYCIVETSGGDWQVQRADARNEYHEVCTVPHFDEAERRMADAYAEDRREAAAARLDRISGKKLRRAA
ncbi:hypothetical protein L0F51_00090 [Afifella sp. H1R]|uniref:hypothetical protein n=1 Tax=Afifella sp. H1R TaxID=2908841 RepID=UPI001F37C180|nr:hypothetical protein [Afifella sp. H1R]MCF1502165.1 hypothetical protein [Afifella sp. H1R]